MTHCHPFTSVVVSQFVYSSKQLGLNSDRELNIIRRHADLRHNTTIFSVRGFNISYSSSFKFQSPLL